MFEQGRKAVKKDRWQKKMGKRKAVKKDRWRKKMGKKKGSEERQVKKKMGKAFNIIINKLLCSLQILAAAIQLMIIILVIDLFQNQSEYSTQVQTWHYMAGSMVLEQLPVDKVSIQKI